MRKFIAIAAMFFSSLFVAQAVMATAAVYSDCCSHGCQRLANCVSLDCKACSAPAAAPDASSSVAPSDGGQLWPDVHVEAAAKPFAPVWSPPD